MLARSEYSQSRGVHYVEFTILNVGSGGMMVGVCDSSVAVGTFCGSDTKGVSYASIGQVYKNNTFTGTSVASYTTNDVIGMQVDLDRRTVKFRKNGGAFSATVDISSLGSEVFIATSLNGTGADASVRAEALVVYPSDTVSWSSEQPTGNTRNIVAHGDSVTLNGGATKPYIQRIAETISNVHWWKAGINGGSWNYAWPSGGLVSSLISDAPNRVDNRIEAGVANWLIAFAGANGIVLNNRTAAQEYADLQTYVNARISAGWSASKIIVCTMMPKTGASEVTRTAYNALIVADGGAIGYKVARIDLDPYIGASGQNTDTRWFIDGSHPTDSGHERLAQIISAQIS